MPTAYDFPDEIQGNLPRINNLATFISHRFLTQNQSVLSLQEYAQTGYDPTLLVNGQTRVSSSDFFANQIKKREIDRRIVILGDSGVGKSRLLCRFLSTLSLNMVSEELEPVEALPISIYLTAQTRSIFRYTSTLWSWIKTETRRFEKESDLDNFLIHWHDLLDIYLPAGLVYILFDGADEIENIELSADLFKSLTQLSEEGANVIVTSRKNHWYQAEKERVSFTEIDLLPPSFIQIRNSLKNIASKLPTNAYEQPGLQFKSWLYKPIVLQPILELAKAGNLSESTFENISSLFEEWFNSLSNGLALNQDSHPELQLKLWEEIALLFLNKRTRVIDIEDLKKLISSQENNESQSQIDSLFKNRILVTIGRNQRYLKFYHEIIKEFLVARRLSKEFISICAGDGDFITNEFLASLKLATTDLDFLRSSVYGFISEMVFGQLQKDILPGFQKLVSFVQKPKDSETESYLDKLLPAERVLRNLIEFIGLVLQKQKDCKVFIKELLAISNDDRFPLIIRFNAVRALERLHPRAPKPYFSYISDWEWGEKRKYWEEIREIALSINIRPNAIRGYQAETIRPAQLYNRVAFTGDEVSDELQKTTSKQLLYILKKELEKSSPENENFMLVNLSLALVRWFHAGDQALLQEILPVARPHSKTYENLTKWIEPAKKFTY